MLNCLFFLTLVFPALAWDGTNWMSKLHDSHRIKDITIPGTHDSAAHVNSFGSSAACQRFYIDQQLRHGIRFLDLRYEVQDMNSRCSYMQVVHATTDSDPVLRFDGTGNIFNQIQLFVKDNPTEFVIVRLKKDNANAFGCSSDSEIFGFATDAVETYLWNGRSGSSSNIVLYSDTSFPPKLGSATLGEVRGKIWLAIDEGDYDAWGARSDVYSGKFSAGGNGDMQVQDEWGCATIDATEKFIKALDAQADWRADPPADKAFINFYSCNNWGNIENVANTLNPMLEGSEFGRYGPNRRCGVSILDFSYPHYMKMLFTWNRASAVSRLQLTLDDYCRKTVADEHSDCADVVYARKNTASYQCFSRLAVASAAACLDEDGNPESCHRGDTAGSLCSRDTDISNIVSDYTASGELQRILDSYCRAIVQTEHQDCIEVLFARGGATTWRCHSKLGSETDQRCVTDTGAHSTCHKGSIADAYCTRNDPIAAMITEYTGASTLQHVLDTYCRVVVRYESDDCAEVQWARGGVCFYTLDTTSSQGSHCVNSAGSSTSCRPGDGTFCTRTGDLNNVVSLCQSQAAACLTSLRQTGTLPSSSNLAGEDAVSSSSSVGVNNQTGSKRASPLVMGLAAAVVICVVIIAVLATVVYRTSSGVEAKKSFRLQENEPAPKV